MEKRGGLVASLRSEVESQVDVLGLNTFERRLLALVCLIFTILLFSPALSLISKQFFYYSTLAIYRSLMLVVALMCLSLCRKSLAFFAAALFFAGVFLVPLAQESVKVQAVFRFYSVLLYFYLVAACSHLLYSKTRDLSEAVAKNAVGVLTSAAFTLYCLIFVINHFIVDKVDGFLDVSFVRLFFERPKYSLFVLKSISSAFMYLVFAVTALVAVLWMYSFRKSKIFLKRQVNVKAYVVIAVILCTPLAARTFSQNLVFSDPVSYLLASAVVQGNGAAGTADDSRLLPPVVHNRKNLIFVFIDTLRPDHTSVYGYDRDTTPFLKSISDTALVVDRFYAHAPLTPYSQKAILMGEYPCRPVKGKMTIFDIMKYNDYDTSVFSSGDRYWWVLNEIIFNRNIDKHFDMNNVRGPGVDHFNFDENIHIHDSLTFDEAEKWISERDGKKFFMYLELQNVHSPYVFNESYPGYTAPFKPYTPDDGVMSSSGVVNNTIFFNRYDDAVLYVDTLLRDFFSFLEGEGILNDTIVVFVSDHGEAYGEHGAYFHGSALYDEELRVFGMIYDGELGRRVDQSYGSHIDLIPSVLWLLNASGGKDFEGKNLFKQEKDGVYLCLREKEGLIWDGKKYYVNTLTGRKHIFDLESDPGETTDLAADEAASSEIDEVYKRFRQEVYG